MPKKTEERLMPEKEVQGFVSMFSLMWKEVGKQFPDLSRDEQLKVFEVISSAFTDFMEMALDEPWDEDDDDDDDQR